MKKLVKKAIKKDLNFLSKMRKKNKNLSEKVIYRNYMMHQNRHKKDDFLKTIVPLALPVIAPLIGDLVKDIENLLKNGFTTKQPVFFTITTDAPEEVELPEVWSEGDKVTLKLGSDIFQVSLCGQVPDSDFFCGTILEELIDTDNHGAKKGDKVRFKTRHILAYEAKEQD